MKAPIEFGYGRVNDWPLVVPSKGKIYGEPALEIWYAENYGKAPTFKTPEAAQKWVDKAYRKYLKTVPADSGGE